MNQIRGTVYSAIILTSHLLRPHASDKQRQPGSQQRNLAPLTHDWQSQRRDHRATLRTLPDPEPVRLITHMCNTSYLEDMGTSLSVCRLMYVNLCNSVCVNGLLGHVSWFALISEPGGAAETGAVCCLYVLSRTIITSQLVSIKATLT